MARNSKNSQRRKPARSRLRIIGGAWRGRSLTFSDAEGLRPTGDRIRETLFNWLAGITPQAHVLDPFAGSGALAFEALSRGAAYATLVEQNPNTARNLRENLQQLNCQNARVEQLDALQFLVNHAPQRCNLVFVDPPFDRNLWQPVFDMLDNGWLAEQARVYVETPIDTCVSPPSTWRLEKQKRAGQVCFSLYKTTSG